MKSNWIIIHRYLAMNCLSVEFEIDHKTLLPNDGCVDDQHSPCSVGKSTILTPDDTSMEEEDT